MSTKQKRNLTAEKVKLVCNYCRNMSGINLQAWDGLCTALSDGIHLGRPMPFKLLSRVREIISRRIRNTTKTFIGGSVMMLQIFFALVLKDKNWVWIWLTCQSITGLPYTPRAGSIYEYWDDSEAGWILCSFYFEVGRYLYGFFSLIGLLVL